MGTVGQKDTRSKDPSCLVVSAASTPTLASSELAAGCTSDLVLNRSRSPELVPQRPGVQVANATHAPDSFGPISLRTKLAAKVTDVKIDASIERRELPAENILNKRLAGQDLSRRFEKGTQQIEFSRG